MCYGSRRGINRKRMAILEWKSKDTQDDVKYRRSMRDFRTAKNTASSVLREGSDEALKKPQLKRAR